MRTHLAAACAAAAIAATMLASPVRAADESGIPAEPQVGNAAELTGNSPTKMARRRVASPGFIFAAGAPGNQAARLVAFEPISLYYHSNIGNAGLMCEQQFSF